MMKFLIAAFIAITATQSAAFTATVNGVVRTANIITGRGDCLIIALHGGGGSADGFEEKADLHSMPEDCTIVIPDGIDNTWNAGDGKHDADDMALMDYIIAAVGAERIYATGLSRGGMMAYWLACNRDIDAIAVVASTLAGDCPDASGTDILHIHGMDDQNVPYEGGSGDHTKPGNSWPPVEDGLNLIFGQNNCATTPMNPIVTVDDRSEYSVDCANGTRVELVLIENGGHAWPGSKRSLNQRLAGIYVCQHLNATQYIADFFSTH